MKIKRKFNTLRYFLGIFIFLYAFSAFGQQAVNTDASSLLSKSILFVSPRSVTLLEGSTIDVSIFINTGNQSINTVELFLNFDPKKMIIVRPSNASSIIGIFVDPPTFSNTNGTMHLSGVIPNGIKTESGLLATITFKAVTTGQTTVSVSPASRVLANDGQGTEVETQIDRGIYTIVPKAPDGPRVFSETHPFQNIFYNNNSPQIAWDQDPAVTNFSYVLDNTPFTVPSNDLITTNSVVSYKNLLDGVWYFHVKSQKQGVWGATTHFTVRIDTKPPAIFKPNFQFITSSSTNNVLVSFFTTDSMSGLDHYEIGIVKNNKTSDELPVFEEVDSPYQFVLPVGGSKVTVRAFDRAGNSIDESIDVEYPKGIMNFVKQNYLLLILLLILLFDLLFGHNIISHLKRWIKVIKREEKKIVEEEKIETHEVINVEIPQKNIETQPINIAKEPIKLNLDDKTDIQTNESSRIKIDGKPVETRSEFLRLNIDDKPINPEKNEIPKI